MCNIEEEKKRIRLVMDTLKKEFVFATVTVIVIIVVPSAFYRIDDESRQLFWSTLSGMLTLVIGIPIGLYIEYIFTAAKARSEKNDLLIILKSNLESNATLIRQMKTFTESRRWTSIRTDTFLLDGNNLLITTLLGPTALRLALSEVQARLHDVNRRCERLMSLLETTSYAPERGPLSGFSTTVTVNDVSATAMTAINDCLACIDSTIPQIQFEIDEFNKIILPTPAA